MRPPSIFVQPLTPEEIHSLNTLWKESDNHRIRTRAQAILLSNRQYSLNEIADIVEVQRDTVRDWIEGWEQEKVEGLQDAPRSGAPPRFTPDEEERILELLDKYPNQPRTVEAIIQKETGKTLTNEIRKRITHQHKYS